jgi:hypothetical protein
MDDNHNGFPPSEGDRLIAVATGILMAWLGMNAPRAEKCLRRTAALMETRPVDFGSRSSTLATRGRLTISRR